MKYQVGEVGRVVVAKFEHDDVVIDSLVNIVRKEQIKAAVFYLIGGIKAAKIVVGPEKENLPPTPAWRELKESHEMVGIGTIFWHDGEPKIHLHGAYGKHESARVGCLRETAETFIVLEGIIFEIKGIKASRELDALSNMIILDMP